MKLKIPHLCIGIFLLLCTFPLTAQNPFTTIIQQNNTNPIDLDIMDSRTIISATDAEIQGSLCVGTDCVDAENYGFDTFRLKENNLRIHFDDTSASASFPGNDWRITINDFANGGLNYFGIDDATANTRPFRIEAGAGNNALYIDDSGNVGIGTDTPVVEVHVADGDSPALRLEQNGASGFAQQTWDVAGNETNFFVRDVTNSSRLPFKIIPNSSTNALVIRGDAIGVGGAGSSVNADASIDLKATNKGLLLNRLTTAQRTALVPSEKGMVVYDTDENLLYSWDGTQWQSGGVDTDDQGADVFQLNGSNELELSLDDDGEATQTVDLSSLLDNTDTQGADVFQLNGSNELELSLDNDGEATQTVDLSSLNDSGTDDQNIAGSGLVGNILTIGIEGGTSETVDLTTLSGTGTDDQNISGSGLAGNTLTIGIEGGASQTVDLSSLDDSGTDDQNISGSGLVGNTLTIGIEGGASQTVDLSSLNDAGTDDQSLSLTGNTLSLENGGDVDLSAYLDNTDDQALNLSGNILTLEDGGTVDLSQYLDNTDDQTLGNFILSGNLLGLSLSNGGTVLVNLSPILEPLEDQLSAAENQIDALNAQMADVLDRLATIEECACDGTLGVNDFNVQPDQPVLRQNIPNPFDNTTEIGYFIPFKYNGANIVISGTSGRIMDNRKIDRLGEGSITVNKERMQAAVYFYTLFVDGKRIATKRMVVE